MISPTKEGAKRSVDMMPHEICHKYNDHKNDTCPTCGCFYLLTLPYSLPYENMTYFNCGKKSHKVKFVKSLLVVVHHHLRTRIVRRYKVEYLYFILSKQDVDASLSVIEGVVSL